MIFKDKTFKERKCPYCKSENLLFGLYEELINGEVSAICTCGNCNKLFYILYEYKLVFNRYENRDEVEIKI